MNSKRCTTEVYKVAREWTSDLIVRIVFKMLFWKIRSMLSSNLFPRVFLSKDPENEVGLEAD